MEKKLHPAYEKWIAKEQKSTQGCDGCMGCYQRTKGYVTEKRVEELEIRKKKQDENWRME